MLCNAIMQCNVIHSMCVVVSSLLQARMDVEPLVRLERRNVSLDALAAGFKQVGNIKHL